MFHYRQSAMSEITTAVLTALLAAIVGSYFTVLAFKRQRLWQEKYEACREAIAALENIRFWADESASSVYMMPTTGFPEGKEPYQYLSDALRKLDYYAVAGSILFGKDLTEKISQARHEIGMERFEANEEWPTMSPEDQMHFQASHAAKIREIADKHLPHVIALAKKECET